MPLNLFKMHGSTVKLTGKFTARCPLLRTGATTCAPKKTKKHPTWQPVGPRRPRPRKEPARSWCNQLGTHALSCTPFVVQTNGARHKASAVPPPRSTGRPMDGRLADKEAELGKRCRTIKDTPTYIKPYMHAMQHDAESRTSIVT